PKFGVQATTGRCVKREVFMHRKIVAIAVGMGVALAASAGAVRAQNSPAGAGIDAALRGAVERKDVPGVVALINDRRRVLKAETVTLMGQNNIGAVSVPALKTALPRSADFSFIADGRDKWGLGFLITTDQVPGKRSPGSLSWGGINNTYFWI